MVFEEEEDANFLAQIDTIEDFAVTQIRELNQVRFRVSIFLSSSSFVGYIILENDLLDKKTGFEGWLLRHKNDLIAAYQELKG